MHGVTPQTGVMDVGSQLVFDSVQSAIHGGTPLAGEKVLEFPG